MFRDENAVYVKDVKYKRREKASVTANNLRDKIAREKFKLKRADYLHLTEEDKQKTQRNIAHLERKLNNISNTCHKTIKTYKKLSLDKIKKYVLSRIAELQNDDVSYITVDDIAHELRVKTHFVKQVFQKLNTEGILSQPKNYAPHDSTRDPWCPGGYNGWQSSLYYIRNHIEEEKDA